MSAPVFRPLARGIAIGLVVLSLTGLAFRTRQAVLNRNVMRAVLAENPSAVEDLIGRGADPNARTCFPPAGGLRLVLDAVPGAWRRPCYPILVWAALDDRYRTIGVLLRHGADPNVFGPGGLPVVSIAANGSAETSAVAELLAAGADPNARGASGATPLMMAAMRTNAEIVELFLRYHADPNARSRWGDGPLDSAAAFGTAEQINLLLKHGADPNVVARADPELAAKAGPRLLMHEGTTALMWAARREGVAHVQALLRGGADPTTRDPAGKSAADIATDPNVRDLLVSAEAVWRKKHAQSAGPPVGSAHP